MGAERIPEESPKHFIFCSCPNPTVTGHGIKKMYSLNEKFDWSKTVTLCFPHWVVKIESLVWFIKYNELVSTGYHNESS